MAEDRADVSRHVSVWVDVAPERAYDYAADVTHLPSWAAGLAGSELRNDGDHWLAESPMGQVRVQFAPANTFGVVDHVVTLPSGQSVYNALRVLPVDDAPGRCEVVFTVRRRAEMSVEEFEDDVAAVERDLQTLKALLEAGTE